MTSENSVGDRTISSAAEIAKTVPKIASALLSLSALGIFVGWRDASAYFNAIGAPWAAQGLSATTLLQSSSGPIAIFAIIAYLSVTYLANSIATTRNINRATLISLILSFVFFLPTLYNPIGISSKLVYGFATAAALLIFVSAGLTFAELIAHFRDTGSKFRPSHLWLVYWVVFYGLLQAPERIGQARAEYHLDVKSEALPIVVRLGTPPSEVWRLVYLTDGKALLMLVSQKREKTIFRIVEAKDILSISSTLRGI